MNKTSLTRIGQALLKHKSVQVAEIFLLFILAWLVIMVGLPMVKGDLFRFQAVLWGANVLMLSYVWLGLRLRGQGWAHLGLKWQGPGQGRWWRLIGLILLVLVGALIAFSLGAVIMGGISGVPEKADMSGYAFLKGNVVLFVITMLGVYIVSSLGEEIVYRAFLMTRIAEIGGNSQMAWRVGLVISAIIFGLAHYSWGVTGIVQTTLMGAFLGWSYLWLGRNLWINVFAHAVMDTLLMAQIFFGP